MSALPIGAADVEAAAARLEGMVHRTPLLASGTLDALVGATIRSKAEHLQRGGSFKIRGALNRLLQLDADERARGVVAYSSGNHAQGVALAARITGIDATIVMPADAPAVKLAATAGYGARVVQYDRYREDRAEVAARVAAERGSVVVPPFDDAMVMAGQGTVGWEVADEWPDVEVAVIPVGGGGLVSGMATALRARIPGVRIVGVEPAIADDARQSLASGRIVTIEPPRTVADGVATTSVGRLTFEVIRALVDEIVTVEEDEILAATAFVASRMKQLVEPTGALTTAALLTGRVRGVEGRNVLGVFCGGNTDLSTLARAADSTAGFLTAAPGGTR